MTRPGGLGRGLGALIPSGGAGESGLTTLRLTSIVPNRRQPRGTFDEAALEELAQSLREVGLLQPIVVRPIDGGRYEIVAGERRFRAARLAGMDGIPALIRRTGDEQLLTESLVENIHRADLNALEESAAYQQLLEDFGFTHDELAKRLGKSRSTISNALRLLALPPGLQHQVASGVLTAGHARAILSLDRAEQQQRVAHRVVAERLSVRETEDLVRRVSVNTDQPGDEAAEELAAGARRRASGPYAHLQSALADALSTRVQIKGTAARGRLVIDYAGRDDLERLLSILGRGSGRDLLREDA